jgi:hypothetical protein
LATLPAAVPIAFAAVDQAGDIVHVLLRTRSALRVELGLAPLYDRNDVVRIHGSYFPFFADAFFGVTSAVSCRLASARACSSASLAGLIAANPFFIPLTLPPFRPSATAAGFLRFATVECYSKR